MYKKSLRVIIFTTLIVVLLMTYSIRKINAINWSNLERGFVAEKQNSIGYYFEDLRKDIEGGVIDYAYCTKTIEALENKDELWIEESVSDYIIEKGLYNIDYILIADKDFNFIKESGYSIKEDILAIDSVKDSLENDDVNTSFDKINNKYAVISSSSIRNNSNQNSIGLFVAVSYVDKEDLNNIKVMLGENNISKIEVLDFAGDSSEISKEKYKTMLVRTQLLDSEYYLQFLYEMEELFDIFVIQRNRLLTIGLLIVFSVCCFMLLFVNKISESINNITEKVKEIVNGNYSIKIKKENGYFTELNDLTNNINKLSSDIKNYLGTINNNYIEMTEVIVNAVEINDQYTSQHNRAVGTYAKIIAEEIGYSSIEDIEKAAKLHDIGKISIPGPILNKPGKLTDEEYEIIKTHPTEGYKIIGNIDYFSNIKLGVKHHHERWDGTGYPDGLVAEDIPLIALIIAIADVYDALTSDRSYRKAMKHEDAVKIITENSGKMFDPLLVKAFLNREEDFKSCLQKMRRE